MLQINYVLIGTPSQFVLYCHVLPILAALTLQVSLISICSFFAEPAQGTLDMRNKTVADAYTPLNRVFMFDIHEKMTQENMNKVMYICNTFHDCVICKKPGLHYQSSCDHSRNFAQANGQFQL